MLIFEGDRSRPGTHALVVGISRYRHLAGGDGPQATEALAYPQLSSAARSAHMFAQWLTKEARLSIPLATCRVMLAPSPKEAETREIAEASCPCDSGAFLEEANDWISDASASADESVIFYFVGHTLHSPGYEDVLLLEDFGAPRRPSFKGSVSFMNIFKGLASTDALSSQVQHFFIDGSRHGMHSDTRYLLDGATSVFDVRVARVDRRTGGIYYAAMAGQQAYAHVDGVTLFVESLLKGLRGAAATRGSEPRRWSVTASSLANWLALDATDRQSEFGVQLQQEFNLRGDAEICAIDSPPPVRVSLELQPRQATPDATVNVFASDGSQLISGQFSSNPMYFELPAGIYSFEVVPAPPWKPVKSLEVVLPPKCTLRLSLDAAEH